MIKMSQTRSTGGLGEADHFHNKVYKIVVSEARIILLHIFNWGCERDLTESFETHAKQNLGMTNKQFKNYFDKTMIEKMNSNPSGNDFDISLLNACIMHACPQLSSDDKDAVIKPIKDFRNKLIHGIKVESETEMNTLIEKLSNMLINAIKRAGEVYGISDTKIDDIVNDMNQKIEEIKDSLLPDTDVITYRENLKQLRKENESVLQKKGTNTLKEQLQNISNVDPVSWFTGKDRLDVKMVFTRLDIVVRSTNSSYSVNHEGLLELQTEDRETPTIIVVEGEAGSGKSTLAKYVLKDWADISNADSYPNVRGLEKYKIVLFVECRNRSISSFRELLLTSIPQVSYEMTDDDLIKAVLSLPTLIVIDGLDEMKDNSEKLVREILEICIPMSKGNLQVITTTRPHKLDRKLFKGHSWILTRLKGIPQERRVMFVERLHDVMKNKGLSKQSTSKLVDYVKQSQSRIGDHYRLPLNLTFLTFLWAEDPEKINSVTSATSLYVAILALIKRRLISRIEDTVNFDANKVEEFIKLIYAAYLKTHRSGDIQLHEDTHKELQEKCKDLGLSFDEMIAPFFNMDTEWTVYGMQLYLSAPHKSLMEFFGAFQIFNCLTTDDKQRKIAAMFEALRLELGNEQDQGLAILHEKFQNSSKTLKDVLENQLSVTANRDNINWPHHQNLLLHLAGLLALKDRDALHDNGTILVDLLKESGVQEEQWLDLVAEADCDSELTKLVSENIVNKLVVRDGHTLAAIEILKNLETNLPVQVIFECEVKYIPEIESFMEKLSNRDCFVELLLKNHWKNPYNGNSTEHLQSLFKKSCVVRRFTGNLDDLNVLPPAVDDLRLTIANDDQAMMICNDIKELEQQLDLTYLGVHIMKEVSPILLKPLPVIKAAKRECGTIWISNVGDADIDQTCKIASALLPKEPENVQFSSIIFPRCKLSEKGFSDLLEELKSIDVKVSKSKGTGGIKMDSEMIDNKRIKDLRILTQQILNCEFYWGDESSVW